MAQSRHREQFVFYYKRNRYVKTYSHKKRRRKFHPYKGINRRSNVLKSHFQKHQTAHTMTFLEFEKKHIF